MKNEDKDNKIVEETAVEKTTDTDKKSTDISDDKTISDKQADAKPQRKKRTKSSNVIKEEIKSENKILEDSTDKEPKNEITKTKPKKSFNTGDAIEIKYTFLYNTSVTPKYFKGIQGKYYVWNDEIVNGRIRLTDSLSGVGKPERIVGWVNLKSI